MKNYTLIHNEIFEESQLSISAKYLYCVLLKACGQKEWCFPSQKTLGMILGRSEKQIRFYLKELELAGIIFKKRTGFNKTNTYKVSKDLLIEEDELKITHHIGSRFPIHTDQGFPPNNTYIKVKDKTIYKRGMEDIKEILRKRGLK